VGNGRPAKKQKQPTWKKQKKKIYDPPDLDSLAAESVLVRRLENHLTIFFEFLFFLPPLASSPHLSPPTSLLPPSTAHLLCFAQPSFCDISSVPTREPRWANGTTEEERVAPGGRRSAPVRGWRSSLRGREEAKELLWVWTWAGRTAGWWPRRRRRRRRRTEAGTTVQTRDTGVDGDSSLSKEHRFVAAKAAFCASGACACSLARARSLSLCDALQRTTTHTHARGCVEAPLLALSSPSSPSPLPLLSTSR
jgi:hypothetical protein